MSRKSGKLHPVNLFKDSVQSTSEIALCYRAGLQALGTNSGKIVLSHTRDCLGSVDIDQCLASACPNESRWDYAFGYQNEAYFVEIHPAQTSEVNNVLQKLSWLKNWLINNATDLEAIKSEHCFHWISSGKNNILPTMPQYRRAAIAGLLPKSALFL